MNDCTPTEADPVVDNPCEWLGKLRGAMYQLLSGQVRAEAKNGERVLSFQRGDAKALQHEIRRLEIICDPSARHGRAIRVGPYVPVNTPRRRNGMGYY